MNETLIFTDPLSLIILVIALIVLLPVLIWLGITVLWIAVMLGGYLLLFFLAD